MVACFPHQHKKQPPDLSASNPNPKKKKKTHQGSIPLALSGPESSPLHATQTGGVGGEEKPLRKKERKKTKGDRVLDQHRTKPIGAGAAAACFYSTTSPSGACVQTPSNELGHGEATPEQIRFRRVRMLRRPGSGEGGRGALQDEYPVKLHIYDLSRGMARQLSTTVLGKPIDAIWHTGVVVHGKEYFFGGGVQQDRPGRTPYGTPARVEHFGVTHVGKEDFEDFLHEISPRYTPETYNLLSNNCNHFSNEVVKFLVGSTVPSYILDQPKEAMKSPIGALIMPMIQGLETTMKAGAAPQQPPQFVPAPAAAAQTQPSTNNIQMQSRSVTADEPGADKTADHDSGIIPAPKEAGEVQPSASSTQNEIATDETVSNDGIIPPVVVLLTPKGAGQTQPSMNNDQIESRSVTANETGADEMVDSDGGIIPPPAKPAAPAAATQTETSINSIELHTVDEGTRMVTPPAVQPAAPAATVAKVTLPAAAASDPLGEAKRRAQEELKQEFVAIMATGTVQAGDAAALAMRRVMERHGLRRTTVPTQRG
ncbi:uncharacterized protein LOC119268685 isoform X1 [Triticum dicoccoides]|nr:uncharacterized protein LOC119268685 isoform X1 [Triticum dicoccoides]